MLGFSQNGRRQAAAAGGPADTTKVLCTVGEVKTARNATWVNPSRVATAGTGTYARSSFQDYDQTHTLLGRGFGFTVPGGATILGVEAFYTSRTSGSIYCRTNLWHGTAILGTTKTTGTPLSNFSEITFGSATDMWGLTTLTLTPAIVNAPTFGISLWTEEDNGDSSNTYDISEISAKVYYTT